MYCCAGCFDDIHLSSHIEKIADQIGDCSYCGATDVKVIEPVQLQDDFQAVAAAYQVSSSAEAKTLAEWFQLDWQMFGGLDDSTASKLLTDILEDSGYDRVLMAPILSTQESPVMKWSEFREEMINRNRFFFRQLLDLDSLSNFFRRLEVVAVDLGSELYRARICEDVRGYELDQLGLPPAKMARSGRANPVGIPYLYAASTPDTALAEVRPHPGDKVCVAQIKLDSSARMVNLRYPRKTVSPFMTLDESEISEFRHQMAFLAHLEEELSKPVLPREADLEYLPTQYLCEFIKNCGYDGLVFRSSLSDGVNVTLFSDAKVKIVGSGVYEVRQLQYSHQRLS
tara:strand:- start:15801 stop:16823 length:1023 start_codon:yes stop_codon:yes gene_type:complete